MPRLKKTKEQKAIETLQRLLPELKDTLPTKIIEQDPSHEAEAVLTFIQSPRLFITKKCKRCKAAFSTNYKSVGYCSNTCRALALAELGIKWDPFKPLEVRWGGEPPLVISPEAMQTLMNLSSQTQIEMNSYEPSLDVLSFSSPPATNGSVFSNVNEEEHSPKQYTPPKDQPKITETDMNQVETVFQF